MVVIFRRISASRFTALILGAVFLLIPKAWAGSCCGGGSASSLILPKISKKMLDISISLEQYDGFWNTEGKHIPDPPGSDLKQYRLNLGYAMRLGSRLQGSIVIPYVWNDNKYAAVKSGTSGQGDTTLSLWYETFDNIMCVWKVNSMKDLIPAAYFGVSLTVPTGISPYNDVNSSFDITGRGFYRLDGKMLLDKTIYPWTGSFLYSYGLHFERPVNREYGKYVEPYHKNLGNRRLWSLSIGHTHYIKSMNSLTVTAAYSDLWEGQGNIDGRRDPVTGFEKRSLSLTMALATLSREWIWKFTWNHPMKQDDWGRNFPSTDVFTMGVSHVFR